MIKEILPDSESIINFKSFEEISEVVQNKSFGKICSKDKKY